VSSQGYNIEDRDTCGLTGPGDKVSTDPLLAALPSAPDGASAPPLQPGSPAINGGSPAGCSDAAGAPLTRDERGVARPQGARCDIGPFEFRTPTLGAGATVSGAARTDQTLTCNLPAVASPDGPVATTVQWLRDGTPVAGATAAAYPVASADAGHAIACRFTASNAAGSVDTTSPPVAVPGSSAAARAPRITLLSRTARVSLRTGRGTLRASCSAPAGQRCSFTGSLRTRTKPGRSIGRATGSIAVAAVGKLSLRLTSRGRSLLRRERSVRVRLTGTTTDRAGKRSTISTTITLRARR
jgi:hypothetical protein